MLQLAGLPKKMNSFSFLFFFLLLPQPLSFGRCHDISFSVCWMSKDADLERQGANIWLNDVALKPIRKLGKVTSLTLYPAVEHQLTLQYGGSVHSWTITIAPSAKSIKVRGRQKPSERPTNVTKGFLGLLKPSEVFACENRTLFFHQDENLLLATGHTASLPIKLRSRSPSMLLVSWVERRPAVGYSHTVTLFHSELGSYNALSTDTTTHSHYRFTALDSCSSYVACVEISGSRSFTCLSALTDPDIPQDFDVTSWNSSSMSLAWSCPQNLKYSLFLLTVFYLNGTDHVVGEVPVWHKEDTFVFTLSELQPCSRVQFGLQTVCLAGLERRLSKMVLNDGNSVLSNIESLRQTSFGPENYTLRWEVRDTTSVSTFRVYDGATLQGTTSVTSYTAGGLLPCRLHRAKVEALCGESVLMSAKTVTAHTGPRGVSELKFHPNNSTALWVPGTTQPSAVVFLYELSLENGSSIQSSRLTGTELRLPGLQEGKTYVLDVWEECDGRASLRSSLRIERANSSLQQLVRAAGPDRGRELQSGLWSNGLTVVLPWSLPHDLQDDVQKLLKDEEEICNTISPDLRLLQQLLKDFDPPAPLERVTILPTKKPDTTEILFMSSDVSKTQEDVSLSAEVLLHYIRSLNSTNITVTNGVVHWDGPDLCASSESSLCPVNSLCVSTLGSYACVCQHGHYDVSSVVEPLAAAHPLCYDKGLFSQCEEKLLTGGIAKPYLTSYMGGPVEVKLNNGRCSVEDRGIFYYFRTSQKSSDCGTERRVNKTHIVFQNTLSVTEEQTISRRDLKVAWTCVYPRLHLRKAQVSLNKEWFTSLSLVESNSSLQLAPTMTLHTDETYTHQYTDAIYLGLEDALFFQVALQTNNSFAPDVLLQLDSCWATESTSPHDTVQGVFLQDGCPVENTFHWLSGNGLAQSSRFSIEMFTMPQQLPLYFHCLTNVCGRDESCAKNCTGEQRAKRSVSQGKRFAVVSAGPLVVCARTKSGIPPTSWSDHMTMILIVAGSIGMLAVTVLSVSATKAIMTYYEPLQKQ